MQYAPVLPLSQPLSAYPGLFSAICPGVPHSNPTSAYCSADRPVRGRPATCNAHPDMPCKFHRQPYFLPVSSMPLSAPARSNPEVHPDHGQIHRIQKHGPWTSYRPDFLCCDDDSRSRHSPTLYTLYRTGYRSSPSDRHCSHHQ